MDKNIKTLIDCKIVKNIEIAPFIYDMIVEAKEIADNAISGQFVEVYTNEKDMILPRPISICEIIKEKGQIRLVYQIAGKGTERFSNLKKDDCVKILGPLGNGYSIDNHNDYVLVGGGVGVPPLVQIAKVLKEKGNVHAFLGYRTTPYLIKDLEDLGVNVHVATDSGEFGFKGNVIELMNKTEFKADVIYSCGPKIMLKNLAKWAINKNIPCQVSMEERMACGIGACVGCVVKIKNGDGFTHKKVCKDGPVFDCKEVLFDE